MILIIYLIYLIFVFAYFETSKNKSTDIFGCVLISIFVPFFGLLMSIIHNSNKIESVNNYDLGNETKSVKRKSEQVLLNEIYSSFDNDLIYNEYETAKRKILMFNKFSLDDQCRLYLRALNCSNTEIVHLAAASLMKIKQKFEKEIIYNCSSSSDDFENYTVSLNSYVNSNLIEGTVKDKLIIEFLKNLDNAKFHESSNKKFYKAVINLCNEIKDYKKATLFIEIMLRKWKYDEQCWLVALKTAYNSKDKEWFLEIINELKQLDLCVSKKTQNIIKLWGEDYAK